MPISVMIAGVGAGPACFFRAERDAAGARWPGTRTARGAMWTQVRVAALAMALLLLGASVGRAQPTSLPCAVTGVGAGDSLSMRAAADPVSPIVDTIPRSETAIALLDGPVKVAGKDWFRVRYGNAEGWVNGHYLLCPASPEEARRIIADEAAQIVRALHDRNMSALAVFVDPQKGVRFSPYVFVDPHNDVVMSPAQLRAALADRRQRRWGAHDGSGEPIRLNFPEYYRRFVYDRDFSTATEINYNVDTRRGNTRNNIREIYPGAIVVEYFLPGGTTDETELNWVSLRLVFQRSKDRWLLAGIVHDEWTI